jgi:hypothetical protein
MLERQTTLDVMGYVVKTDIVHETYMVKTIKMALSFRSLERIEFTVVTVFYDCYECGRTNVCPWPFFENEDCCEDLCYICRKYLREGGDFEDLDDSLPGCKCDEHAEMPHMCQISICHVCGDERRLSRHHNMVVKCEKCQNMNVCDREDLADAIRCDCPMDFDIRCVCCSSYLRFINNAL